MQEEFDCELYLDTLSQVIAYKRKELDISQSALARGTGLSRWYISDIERGARSISIKNLVKLSVGLQTPLSTLLKDVETRIGGNLYKGKTQASETGQCFLIFERDLSDRFTIVSFDDYLESCLGSQVDQYIGQDLTAFFQERLGLPLGPGVRDGIKSLNGKAKSIETDSGIEMISIKPLLKLDRGESLIVLLLNKSAVSSTTLNTFAGR